MQFPEGGDLVRRLQFPRIDKDEMCVQWKSFYREFGVPAQVGVEMTGLERAGRYLAGRGVEPQPEARADHQGPPRRARRSAAACRGASTSRATWPDSRSR